MDPEDGEAIDAWSGDATQENTNNSKQIYKDYSKPNGEACREEGTLKDVSELDWPDSPSDPSPHDWNGPWNLGEPEEDLILKIKSPGDEDESSYESDELPKVKVSCDSL